MKILVTGSRGFVGKNLIAALRALPDAEVLEYDMHCDEAALDEYCKEAGFVFHLAGVNRPENDREYEEGNAGFTRTLTDILVKNKNYCPVMLSSSVQALLKNPYGISKKHAEDIIFEHGKQTGAPVYVYRLPNLYGKWCKPDYNSVTATFCHNIARNLPITVTDPNKLLSLLYIDDLVSSLTGLLSGRAARENGFCVVNPVYSVTLGELAGLIRSFKSSRESLIIPNMRDGFTKSLYSTYLSYLPPENGFSYPLKMNADERGSFTELYKTAERGQTSVNVIKPGVTKGNHYHNLKNEKFIVAGGQAEIRFRKIDSDEIFTYNTDGSSIQAVDIPPGYTHSIKNTGTSDLITVMWASECFNPENPDSYYLEVGGEK